MGRYLDQLHTSHRRSFGCCSVARFHTAVRQSCCTAVRKSAAAELRSISTTEAQAAGLLGLLMKWAHVAIIVVFLTPLGVSSSWCLGSLFLAFSQSRSCVDSSKRRAQLHWL